MAARKTERSQGQKWFIETGTRALVRLLQQRVEHNASGNHEADAQQPVPVALPCEHARQNQSKDANWHQAINVRDKQEEFREAGAGMRMPAPASRNSSC